MRKRLTDQEIKTIIARYIEGESMRSLARRFDVAPSTVKRAIDRSVDIVELARCKQEENTVEMLEFMGDRRAKAQSFIDLCLESLQDGEKLEKASLQQIATSLAIHCGQVYRTTEKRGSNAGRLSTADCRAVTEVWEAYRLTK